MISRRTILAWLGFAPVALSSFPGLAAEILQPAIPVLRTRPWRMRLEADGSTTLVDGDKRYLEGWVKSIDKVEWDGLPDVEKIIQDDIAAVDGRVKARIEWNDLDLVKTREATVFPPGTRFEADVTNARAEMNRIAKAKHPTGTFGHTEEDYWETWSWMRGRPPTVEERQQSVVWQMTPLPSNY